MKKMSNLFVKVILNLIPNYRKEGKTAVWKFIIQTLINILTAIATAMTATYCFVTVIRNVL